MPRRSRAQPTLPAVEKLIRSAASIGELERMAGLPSDEDSRAAFWMTFAKIHPARGALEAGAAELRRRIRQRHKPPHKSSPLPA